MRSPAGLDAIAAAITATDDPGLARDELRDIARLSEDIQVLDRRIGERIHVAAPALLALQGCGELTAARIVAEVARVERFRSEAAFARYVGWPPSGTAPAS
jgi:transposase